MKRCFLRTLLRQALTAQLLDDIVQPPQQIIIGKNIDQVGIFPPDNFKVETLLPRKIIITAKNHQGFRIYDLYRQPLIRSGLGYWLHVLHHEFSHVHDDNKKMDAFKEIYLKHHYKGKDMVLYRKQTDSQYVSPAQLNSC